MQNLRRDNMKRITWLSCMWLGTLLVIVAAPAAGQNPKPKKLIVATRHTPPFAIRTAGGLWEGLSIDIWRQIAHEHGWDFELREMELGPLLEAVEKGNVDAAVAAVTVTDEREERMDFSHPFFTTGLGLAIAHRERSQFAPAFSRLLSLELLEVVAGTACVFFLLGLLLYYFERKRNAQQFGPGFWRGLGAGIWWAIVTATTVGYGDKTPRSVPGRLIAVVWMFSSIFLIVTFTASLSSLFTVRRINAGFIDGPEDLPGVRIASVANSTAAAFVKSHALACREYATGKDALVALRDGKHDVVVYDAPILRFLAYHELEGQVRVLPRKITRQDYAIALPSNSPLRESCNRTLLKIICSKDWQQRMERYLGKD